MQFHTDDDFWSVKDSWDPFGSTVNKPQVNFTMSCMLDYFINRKAVDGLSNNDFRTVNSKAYPIFKAGHIQCVFVKTVTSKKILVNCVCLPEMKKDRSYVFKVVFNSSSGEIEFAACVVLESDLIALANTLVHSATF